MNDKGNVTIDTGECKGCGLCVEACVPKVLQLSEGLNPYGYHAASYAGHGCTGCGLCQYYCPTYPKSIVVIPKAAKANDAK